MGKSIYVIGNSFVGALIRAAAENPSIGQEITVAAAGGVNFCKIGLENGILTNCRIYNAKDPLDVRNAKAIFVYARLPTPHDMATSEMRLTAQGYSTQVIAATHRDMVETSESFLLYSRLRLWTKAPISLLSSNIPSNSKPIKRNAYERGTLLIRRILGDNYLEFPPELFGEGYVPRNEFYKNSIRITGDSVASMGEDEFSRRKHDITHMNVLGGSVILHSIIARANSLTFVPHALSA